MIFNPKIHAVEIKKDLVSNLLKRAVNIDAQKIPPAISTECEDCAKMDVLLNLFRDGGGTVRSSSVIFGNETGSGPE